MDKEADPQNSVVSGLGRTFTRYSALAGDGAEGRVEDVDGDLNRWLVPQNDARRFNGPQSEVPSANWTHSASNPAPLLTGERETFRTWRKILNPKLPVSSRMSSMVWQVVVPGVQTVTLTHGLFR